MLLRDELNPSNSNRLSPTEIISILHFIKAEKELEIEQLKDKIKKYEEKKRAEMVFYQSLSPVRKLFASRTPSHHQAVEYIVYVKDRLNKINKLNQQLSELENLIQQLKEESTVNATALSSSIIEEIKQYTNKRGI